MPGWGTLAGRLNVPKWYAGYRIVQTRDRDDFGAVYIASSLTAGGPVFLRVLRPDWGRDAVFTAHFLRGAFAVAQLDHPNLIRVLDFGTAHGTAYLVQEWVEGTGLADLLGQRKRLDAQATAAVGLQVARGLDFAHRQGLYHGDLRPGVLTLDRSGTVKVRDLGLIRSPAQAEARDRREAPLPSPGASTPAPDPPLPAEDRATLQRADLIGLGWTLQELATGRARPPAPAAGTALPAPTPEELATAGLDGPLAEIVLKLLADRPEAGFRDMDEAARALAAWLKVPGPESLSALEEPAARLRDAADICANAPTARLRTRILAGWFGGCGLIALLSLLIGWKAMAWSFIELGSLTALVYFAVVGISEGSPLIARARAFVFRSRLADWLTILAVVGLIVAVLVAIKAVGSLIAFGAATAVLTVAMRREIDRPLARERSEPLATAREIIKSLRLQGVSDETLWRLVHVQSGPAWRSWFRALFGTEALRQARLRWDRPVGLLTHWSLAALREAPLISIDRLLLRRGLEQDRIEFQAIEERRLCARGVYLLTARRRAHRIAAALVAEAAEWWRARGPDGPVLALGPMLDRAACQPESILVEVERTPVLSRAVSRTVGVLFGPRVRFLLGSALLAGFIAWLDQNGMLPRERLRDLVSRASQVQDLDAAQKLGQEATSLRLDLTRAREPFRPETFGPVFAGFGAGLSGLLLVLSAFFAGARISLFVLPAALIAIFGPRLGLPRIGPLDSEGLSLALAAGLAVLGWFFGRERG